MSSPGPVTKLQRSFAYRVSRLFPSEFLRWIDVVSGILDGLVPGGGSQANTRYVSLAGDDTSGNGSFEKPYLTIAKAMSTITTATITSQWKISVGPGTFATNFTIKPFVTIVGAGSGSGSGILGLTLAGVTTIQPTAAQVLDASFAGAGVKTAGIVNCALSTALLANFLAIGNTGACQILLKDVVTENNVTIVGTGAEFATFTNLYQNGLGLSLTLTNLIGSELNVSADASNIAYTQSAAISSRHFLAGNFGLSAVQLTWTSPAIGNFLGLWIGSVLANGQPSISGRGCIVQYFGTLAIAMPDAAARLGFGADNAAGLAGIECGTNVISGTPTANRSLVINEPNSATQSTEIIIRNLATATFNIDFTFTGGTVAPGGQTYVPPGGQVRILYDSPNGSWKIDPYTQAGSATLTNGASGNIVADITTRSKITVTWRTSNGAAGVPLIGTKTAGSRVGGGLFTFTSAALATGVTVATDQGTYDWEIVG